MTRPRGERLLGENSHLLVKASFLYRLPESLDCFRGFFPEEAPAWEWLRAIGPALASLGESPKFETLPPGLHIEGAVFVHPTASLPHYGTLLGPIWIGPGSRLAPGCYLRGNVIVGAQCVVGHNAEIKNALLMDGVQIPHRPYVGDSVLGNGTHLGAGVVLSNLRLDQKTIKVRLPAGIVDTGLRKFGALLGDQAEVGCNAVLNPGTILGKRALVTPAITVGGYIPAATIAHARVSISHIPLRE